MSALSDVRAAQRDAIQSDALPTFSVVPEHATPPMAYVAPGDPYVTREGATFGGEIVRTEVVVVASAGVNESQAEELDDLALAAVDALDAADYFVTDVGRPGRITLNGQSYLALAIGVQTEIHR